MGFSFLSVRLCFSCWFRISVIPKSSIMQDICMSGWVSLSRNYSYSQGCTGWSWHSSTRLSHVKISQRFYCNEILFFFIFIECSFSFIFLHHPLQAVTKVGMLINVINSHFHIASQRMHSKLRDKKKKKGGLKEINIFLYFLWPLFFF